MSVIKMISEGEKFARATSARFIKAQNENGYLGLEVRFSFEERGTHPDTMLEITEPKSLNHVFWLSPNAIKGSFETLVKALGYNGSKELKEDGTLVDGVFSTPDARITVRHELDDKGKAWPRVQWVNPLAGSIYQALEKEDLKKELVTLDFDAMFAQVKSGMKTPTGPVSDKPENPGMKANGSTVTQDDLAALDTDFDVNDVPF